MHDYRMTGRKETDECLKLANKAHSYYFEDPLRYKLEFAKAAKEFFESIERKFCSRTKKSELDDALEQLYEGNKSKIQYISTELKAVKKRLDIIIKNPGLIDKKTKFVLDYTARFIEIILPYACGDIKEEVENNRKFNFKNIVENEFVFFNKPDSKNVDNDYLNAFYENSWRVQVNLNSFNFIKDHLNMNDSAVSNFYRRYGGIDTFSSLIFARMANEQFMKYLSLKYDSFWKNLGPCLPKSYSEEKKDKIISTKDVEDQRILMPSRIWALGKAGVLNELIVSEVLLVNTRGNNIAHYGSSGIYSSCYHNLEILNYLNRYCK